MYIRNSDKFHNKYTNISTSTSIYTCLHAHYRKLNVQSNLRTKDASGPCINEIDLPGCPLLGVH